MKRNKQTTKSLTYRGDIRVFYQLILDHFQNETEPDVENMNTADFKQIYEKFHSTAGTSKNLRLAALVDHYHEKIKGFVGNRVQRVQQLKDWYEQDGYMLQEEQGCNVPNKKPRVEPPADTNDVPPISNTSKKQSTSQELQKKVFFGKSFCLINFLYNDVGKVFRRAAKTLILAHEGNLVDEDDLDIEVHPDCFIINFGPIKEEIMEFLDIHHYDLYKPSLIFCAIEQNIFEVSNSHISMRLSELKNQTGATPSESVWWVNGEKCQNCPQIDATTKSDKVVQTVETGFEEHEMFDCDKKTTNDVSTETEVFCPILTNTTEISKAVNSFKGGPIPLVHGNNWCTRFICGMDVHFQIFCDDTRLQECLLTFSDKIVARQMRTILYMADFASTTGETDTQAIANGVYQSNSNPLKQVYKKLSVLLQDVQKFLGTNINVQTARTKFQEIPEHFWKGLEAFLESKKREPESS